MKYEGNILSTRQREWYVPYRLGEEERREKNTPHPRRSQHSRCSKYSVLASKRLFLLEAASRELPVYSGAQNTVRVMQYGCTT